MTKVFEVINAVNDFIDTWQKHSAVIVTLIGNKDITEISGYIDFIKGLLVRK